jgi:hypothetical protein
MIANLMQLNFATKAEARSAQGAGSSAPLRLVFGLHAGFVDTELT